MIPKIEFRYSDIYDRGFRESKFIQSYLKKKGQEYPSKKEILRYVEKAKKLWAEDRRIILKEVSRISGFKWKQKIIICYVVGVGRPISDPLTIRTYGKNVERFIETLTHEMIHQIFVQNNVEYKKWHKYVLKKYKDELRITKTHILLSAVHWKLLEKIGNKNAVEKEIRKYDKDEGYKRAWEIVKEETPDGIIQKFKEVIRK